MDALPGALERGRFLGARGPGGAARAVLLGVPLDATTSFQPGTRFAPARIREASESLETFSPQLGRDLADLPFWDAGDLELPRADPEGALAAIERAVAGAVAAGWWPLLLGGEHLLTVGSVRAVAARHPGLAVVQFDAHADLRDDYGGQRLSHATAMRRVLEVDGVSLHQLGIRSGTREEWAFAYTHSRLASDLAEGARRACRELAGRPVYVSIDIDVVDPGFAPGTGTPEPGGCTPVELFQALYQLATLRVVGMDVVEVCPPAEEGYTTSLLAAKLVREALLAFAGEAPG